MANPILRIFSSRIVRFAFSSLLLGFALFRPWGEQTGYAEVFIVRLNIAAFHVKIRETQPGHNGLGQCPAVDGDAIGLAIDIVEKVGVVVLDVGLRPGDRQDIGLEAIDQSLTGDWW